MNLKVIFISLFSFFLCFLGRAQEDSLYIGRYKHSYAITPAISQEFLALTYEDDKDTFTFEPNRPVNLGLAFAWKNSSLSYGYGFSGMRDKEKGKSTTVDFQYHVFSRRFILDIYYQQYKGFYQFDERLKEYFSFDKLRINRYGGRFTYVFNSTKFSIAAAHNRNSIQKNQLELYLLEDQLFLMLLKIRLSLKKE